MQLTFTKADHLATSSHDLYLLFEKNSDYALYFCNETLCTDYTFKRAPCIELKTNLFWIPPWKHVTFGSIVIVLQKGSIE